MAPISLALCSVLLWQGVIVSAHTAEAVTTADGDVYVRQRDMELQDAAHTSTASFKKGVDVGAVDKDGSVRRHGMASLLDVDNTLASELTTKELLGEIEDLKLQLVAKTAALQARAVGGDKEAQVAHIQARGSTDPGAASGSAGSDGEHWSTQMMNSLKEKMIEAANNVNETVVQEQMTALQANTEFTAANPGFDFVNFDANEVVTAFDLLADFAQDDASLDHLKLKFEEGFPAAIWGIVAGAVAVPDPDSDPSAPVPPAPLLDLWQAIEPGDDGSSNPVTEVMKFMISAFIQEQMNAASDAVQEAAEDGSIDVGGR